MCVRVRVRVRVCVCVCVLGESLCSGHYNTFFLE